MSSLGSRLEQNGIGTLASTANDITSSKPLEFNNWEAYHEDLLINNPTTDTRTQALIEIAANNTGDIVQHEDHQRPVTFGLTFAKPLSDRWSIETGLRYSLLRSTFSMGRNGYCIDQQQNLHYIGIPLQASYRLWDCNRLSVNAISDITLHIPVYGSTTETYIVNHQSTLSGSWHVYAPWQFSIGTGVSLQYRLTPSLGLYIAPTFIFKCL